MTGVDFDRINMNTSIRIFNNNEEIYKSVVRGTDTQKLRMYTFIAYNNAVCEQQIYFLKILLSKFVLRFVIYSENCVLIGEAYFDGHSNHLDDHNY